MAEQMGFDFGDGEMKKPTKAEEAKEKARARAAENAEYADKRTPRSDMIRQAEIEKMKEILEKKGKTAQSSMISSKGNTTAAGRGTAYGGGDLEKGMQGGRMRKPSYKKGGPVKSSASSRGDGCAQRGKTKGRIV